MSPRNDQFPRVAIAILVLAAAVASAGAIVVFGAVDGSSPDLDGALAAQGPSVPNDAAGTDGASERLGDASDDASSSVQDDDPDVIIRDVGYEGFGVVRVAYGVTYIVADEPHRLEVTIETGEWSGDAEVCIWTQDEGTEDAEDRQSLGCDPLGEIDEHDVAASNVGFDAWEGNETGETTVHVAVVGDPDGQRETLAETSMAVQVLDPDEDISASGLTTQQELAAGTDFRRADTDGDGLSDGQEIQEIGTDPLARDTAGNGVPDGMEVILGTDPNDPLTPHVYLLLLAVPFVIGLMILGVAFGEFERLGRQWQVDRSGESRAASDGRADSSGAATGRGSRDVDGGRGAPTPGEADQFITDEERVIRLLERNGGRMPQSELVEETDWSKSKVSRLLSRMEDDGTITKIPIGRKNLITLGSRDEFASPVLGGEA